MRRLRYNERTMAQSYTNLKKLSDKHGEIEFQAEIAAEALEARTAEELARAAEQFAMPGFRKGKVPHHVVREYVGEMDLLEDAAEEALREAMQEIAADEKLDVIGRPQLTVTKLAPGNPVEFKIRYALAPEVSLPDYKKIARTIGEKQDDDAVTEAEIDEAVTRIRTMIAPQAEGEKQELPPLTDEDVKKFGPFNTVADFRVQLKRSLEQEKAFNQKEMKRDLMIKEIVKAAKAKIPAMIVEQEYGEFVHDRDEQLERAKMPLEAYLKESGKTAEAMEKEEREIIENDIKTSLVIQAIRTKENLAPEEREVQIQIAQLKLRYPDRDEATLRRTAQALVLQEKLFALLEGTPSAKGEEETAPEAA